MTSFSLADLERAHETWRCSCGPAALAAICDLTLDDVRPHFPGFSGWVNPTMMFSALGSVRRKYGRRWHTVPRVSATQAFDWPRYGLARIQWEGPWLGPGVNPRVAYRYTHWVGVETLELDGSRAVFVWDVNAVKPRARHEGWQTSFDWERLIVPLLMPKRGTGWHITHAIEVSR